MLGSGAVVWDYGTPTLTGPCLPRAAVVSHLCIPAEIRPVDKSTSTRTTPLHMGWTHAHALPTPTPTPRRAMLSYALPVPVPSHSVSIPYLLARPALRRPAATLTDSPGPTPWE